MDEVDPAVVRALYRTEPEQFVAQRATVARELKQRGEKAAAATVAALRRPKVAEHVLNVLADAEPALVDRWATAVANAEREQAAVIAGAPATGLAPLLAQVRAAAAELTDAAVQRLGDSGAAQRTAIADTIRAATSTAGAARVRAGLLGAPFEPSDEFFPGALEVSVRPKPPTRPARATKGAAPHAVGRDTPPSAAGGTAARRAAERAAATAAKEEQRRRAAEAEHRRAVERATARVRHAMERQERAQRDLDAAADELRAAEAALAELQRAD